MEIIPNEQLAILTERIEDSLKKKYFLVNKKTFLGSFIATLFVLLGINLVSVLGALKTDAAIRAKDAILSARTEVDAILAGMRDVGVSADGPKIVFTKDIECKTDVYVGGKIVVASSERCVKIEPSVMSFFEKEPKDDQWHSQPRIRLGIENGDAGLHLRRRKSERKPIILLSVRPNEGDGHKILPSPFKSIP